jgi:DNA-binding transcriptional regulator LsrR (DeoR family)
MCTTYDCRMTVRGSAGTALATQAARMFFQRQLTKIEIAGHLGISRFRVARLIDQALADGLVRIEFRDMPTQDAELAHRIEEQAGLDLCLVADAAPTEAETTIRVARLAGRLIGELLMPAEVVGIAWGSTLAAVVAEIEDARRPDLEVVQLAGGSSQLGPERDPGELARLLAERLGASHRPLFAPAFVESRRLRDSLVRQPDVASAVAQFSRLTTAVVGIGAMPDSGSGGRSSLVGSGVLGAAEIERLVTLGAVGDLVVHPFDAAGTFVAPDLADRAVAVSIEELRRTRRVVAVAAGTGKARAIAGALATHVVRVLVTDSATADRIVALLDRRKGR